MAKHSGRLELTWTDREMTLFSTKPGGEWKYILLSENGVDHAGSSWAQIRDLGR